MISWTLAHLISKRESLKVQIICEFSVVCFVNYDNLDLLFLLRSMKYKFSLTISSFHSDTKFCRNMFILTEFLHHIWNIFLLFYIFLSSKMFRGNFHFNEGKVGFTVKGHLENIWLLHFQKLQTADILGEHIFKFLTYSCQIQINNSIFKYSNFHHYQNLRIYIGN